MNSKIQQQSNTLPIVKPESLCNSETINSYNTNTDTNTNTFNNMNNQNYGYHNYALTGNSFDGLIHDFDNEYDKWNTIYRH